ncbi:MAG: helix-turn-helix transcriptional regulator [Ruthenibacterium sp.]
MDGEKIGAFVAARRKALDMTQQQLADALGVTNKAVSKRERALACRTSPPCRSWLPSCR